MARALARSRDADLTAAARIRDAALRRFAAAGVAGTSIRDVAKAAGVSPGLVQHHYRSKKGLRRAVDEHVTRRATAAFAEAAAGTRPDESALRVGRRISAFVRENPDAFAYIGRSLVEGDAPGTELLRRLIELARVQVDELARNGLLRRDLDRDWTVLHVLLIDVGAFLLEPTLARFLGAPLRGEAGLQRMERATTALFLEGIFRARTRGRSTDARSPIDG